MARDTKFTVILFLIYVVSGCFHLIDSSEAFNLLNPFLIVMNTILCLSFLFFHFRNLPGLFFFFFMLMTVGPVVEMFFGTDYSWVTLIGFLSAPVFLYSNWLDYDRWGKLFWIPIVEFAFLGIAMALYWFIPEFLILSLIGLCILSMAILMMNGRNYELTTVVKRQTLVLAFSSSSLTIAYTFNQFI